MGLTADCQEIASESSYIRFIEATIAQWEAQGSAGVSARQLSAAVGVPVSSIYHHFGSLEHLFQAAQQSALTSARRWCDRQLEQISGMAASPATFAGFFAHLVDDWAQEQRALAFAWHECRALARNSPLLRDQARNWAALWAGFWRETGSRFAFGDAQFVVERAFENESLLHMIRWRRAVDRAVLDETARTLAAWLSGSPAPPSPWRDFAREQALESMPPPLERDGTSAQIVAAATEIIATTGVTGLTHRAVAERAGVSLGTVSHKFRTKSALVEAAFEGIYQATVGRFLSAAALPPAPDAKAAIDGMAHVVVSGARESGQDTLFVVAARDAGLSQFGAQLRYLRGRTTGDALRAILGAQRPPTSAEAALFSSIVTSQVRTIPNGSPDDARALGGRELHTLFGLLQRSRA